MTLVDQSGCQMVPPAVLSVTTTRGSPSCAPSSLVRNFACSKRRKQKCGSDNNRSDHPVNVLVIVTEICFSYQSSGSQMRMQIQVVVLAAHSVQPCGTNYYDDLRARRKVVPIVMIRWATQGRTRHHSSAHNMYTYPSSAQAYSTHGRSQPWTDSGQYLQHLQLRIKVPSNNCLIGIVRHVIGKCFSDASAPSLHTHAPKQIIAVRVHHASGGGHGQTISIIIAAGAVQAGVVKAAAPLYPRSSDGATSWSAVDISVT